MSGNSAVHAPQVIASAGSLELIYPACARGIGSVIASPSSRDLIGGVRIEPLAIWPDDRGYFLEVQRMGCGLAGHFPFNSSQISTAFNYPGTIKAFHFHKFQTDLWVPAMGMFQVVLVDLRPDSKTFGLKNTLYCGALKPWQVLIPPGVGHGYKVIGEAPGMLVYVTSRIYDPSDEGRIAYNDPSILYDWELQHK